MATTVRERAAKLLTSNKNHVRYLGILAFMALVVGFGVTAMLKQNGVAMTHTKVVLDCHVAGEVAHTHSADCYDDEGNLVCTLPERELHTHTDECYEETRTLACGLEESDGHQHSDACYDDEGNLVCGLEESEGHTHTDACYEVTRELVCGLPELTEEHVHGPGCFVTVQVEDGDDPAENDGDVDSAAAGGEAAGGDETGGDPADADDTPAYDDPVDDETAAEMPEQTFEHTFTQTDEYGNETPVLTVHVDAPAGALPEGSTMQAQWVNYDELTQKEQAALDDAVATETDGKVLKRQLVDIKFFDAEDNEVEPQRKVMVTFTSELAQSRDKAVVVHLDDLTPEEQAAQQQALDEGKTAEEAEPERKAQVVDQLTDNALERREAELGSDQLAFDAGKFSTYVLNLTSLKHTMQANGETVTVVVEAPAAAGIPADATLSVTEIGDAGGYQGYLSQVSEVVPEENIQLARFFDITIVDGEGNEVQPSEPVTVRIELADAPEGDDAASTVVHFPDEGGMDVVEATEDAGTTTFDAEGFSVYGVVYTVDFHYEVDGKTYDFSIPGGGYMSLRNLVEVLGVAEGAGMSPDEFVAQVADVQFSDPSLVWVGKVEQDTTVGGLKQDNGLQCEPSADLTEEDIAAVDETPVSGGDWALVSLRPFDTEETLTVAMVNGEQVVIEVTDYQSAATDMTHFNTGNTNRFVIWGTNNGRNYVLKVDGTTEEFDPATIDTLGADYLWTIEYGWRQGWDGNLNTWDYRYYIRPLNNPSKYLNLSNGYIEPANLVSTESCGIRLYSPYSYHKNQTYNYNTNDNSGWILEGWGWTRLNLGNSSHQFEGNQQYCSNINISRVQPPLTYDIIVQTDNYNRGAVSGTDKDGRNRQAAESFIAVTENSNTMTKRNLNEIEASPQTGQWMFDYWDLDGKTLYWDRRQQKIVFEENANTEVYSRLNNEGSSIINAYSLPITFNGSTLTAHFKRNPNYVVPDEDKDGRPIDATIAEWLENLLSADFPLNKDATQKTAEVYDYENRIYRVDITAASNLYALDKNVKLGFILDVSGSMKFPSQLDMVSNSNNTQTTTVKENQLKLELNKINDSRNNRENWLNRSTTYYMIADVAGTATVNRIFYDWSSNEWKFVDSSKSNSEANTISRSTVFHSSGDTGKNYPIYMAGDPITAADLASEEGNLLSNVLGLNVGDPKPRAFYLQRSMRETTATLQQIMDKVSVANNPDAASEVLIAWNTFCKTVNGSDHSFKAPANVVFNYTYSGGTSTDRALNDALSFGWGHSGDASRFAILITDGAPQRDGNYVPDETVGGFADTLKANGTTSNTADDITLVTLGLSMGDVHRGEVLLYDIASRDKENVPYYYEAESGNELGLALAEIIRIAMANAIVEGNVTDTVNEAFYPVDKATGLPLENGYVINLNGELIALSESSLTSEQRNAGYGVISETNGTYSVTWTGQEFTWKGWRGTIYEKAKEDFLGGNAVRTNDPNHPAVVTSTGYKLHSGDTAIPFKESIKTAGTKSLETPRVNVNELQIEGNNTEWTVYLGESVNPLEQIKALYNSIKVEQVITNGTDTDGDGFKDQAKWNWATTFEEDWPLYYEVAESASDGRENDAYGEQESFYLSNLIRKINNGNDIDWDELIRLSDKTGDENTGITIPYDLYGQDNPGWITIKLEKNYDTAEHRTEQVGTHVETYKLTAYFSPLYDHIPVGQGGDGTYPYHTGDRGLGPGNAAGTEEIENNHYINVFAKKLQILKVDQGQNAITNDTATFKLYREALEGESELVLAANEVPSFLPTGKSYILADTITTDNEGKATTNIDISKLPNNAPYYLVETDTPDGYIPLKGALEVRAMTDSITSTGTTPQDVWTKVPVTNPPQTSRTKWNPYVLSNWEQNATIIVTGNDDLANFAIREGNITYDHNQEAEMVTVKYKIRNDAGIELPAAGGIGTTAIYAFGGALMLLGGSVLVRKRKQLADAA